MIDLPPGIIYLVQRFPKVALPPALTYVAARVLALDSVYGFQVSWWILSAAILASLPLALTIAVLWDELYIKVDAARKGAVMPLRMGDWSPGSIITLVISMKGFDNEYLGEVLETLYAKFGGYCFNCRILFEDSFVTAEPDYLKAILATQFDEFEKGQEIRSLLFPLLGTGVFAADGDLWKFHRSMTRPFFTKERIGDFDNFDRHAEDAISQLKSRFREGHPVDFQDLMARFTLDSATEFLFGSDVRSLSGGLPYPYYVDAGHSAGSKADEHPTLRFVSAFSEAQAITARRIHFGANWPLIEFWHDKLKGPMRIVHDFIDPIVTEAIKKKREGGGELKQQDYGTLLENLVNSTEDHITLRDEIMSLLVAGRDTTASTLTYVVYMLAEHPEVLHRLREEVLSKLGHQKRPTYDDLRDMKYMRAVINETLRLYPLVPFNVKTSKCQTIFPSKPGSGEKPIYIPARTRIPSSTLVMQRRKDLWGPDALEFDPDRFLDQRLQQYLISNPFIFIPFNAGPRICLGQQFAYNEMSFFLVKLLQHFSTITLAADAQPPQSRAPAEWAEDRSNPRKQREKIRPKAHLTMYVPDGLWMTMQETSVAEDL